MGPSTGRLEYLAHRVLVVSARRTLHLWMNDLEDPERIPEDSRPLEAYGAIGNLRTVALVSRDGSLDWCRFPHLESPSVFASLLDRSRGGRFSVAPVHGETVTQRYLEHTNILETLFETDRGRLAVTDFMPPAGSIDGCGGSRAEDAVYPLIRAEGGRSRSRWSGLPAWIAAGPIPESCRTARTGCGGPRRLTWIRDALEGACERSICIDVRRPPAREGPHPLPGLPGRGEGERPFTRPLPPASLG